jgi:hypothetical protein
VPVVFVRLQPKLKQLDNMFSTSGSQAGSFNGTHRNATRLKKKQSKKTAKNISTSMVN